MKKYIVAIFYHMEGDNQSFVVSAKDAVEAAKNAIKERFKEDQSSDFLDWINNLGDDLESVMVGAIQSDLVLTEPYCLFN